MTTLEKAARAICEADDIEWDDIPDTRADLDVLSRGRPYSGFETREDYRERATAAISSALLDPSDEVVERATLAYLESWVNRKRRAGKQTGGEEVMHEDIRCALRAAGVKITGKD